MAISGITYNVSVTDVRTIFPTSLPDPAIQAALDSAALMYRDRIGGGIADAQTRNEIIRYLAAHFLTLQSPRVASRSVGRTSESYQGQTTTGLSSSHYGQQAQMLDTTGALAMVSMGNGSRLVFEYGGNDAPGAQP